MTIPATDERTRVYPICCTSAYCGRIECSGCPNLPKLEDFKVWQQRTGAVQADPIWSRLVYVVPDGK